MLAKPLVEHDSSAWDKDSALTRLMNNDSLLKQICGIFINNSVVQMGLLSECIDNKDIECVQAKAHSLKGSTGDLGAKELNRLFAAMEESAKKQDIETASSLFSDVQSQYPQFIELITAYVKS